MIAGFISLNVCTVVVLVNPVMKLSKSKNYCQNGLV